jgi:hypothetical protein
MRNEKLSYRGWLALGFVGILASVTIACQGGNFPTTPSTITTGMSPGVSSSSLGSTGTLKLTGNGVTGISDIRRGDDRSKGRGNDARRRIAYCKSLTEGHAHYERCQAWLNKLEKRRGTSRGDRSKKRGNDVRRRIAYCRSLAEGHPRYERCQAWLNKLEKRRGTSRGDRSKKRGSTQKK